MTQLLFLGLIIYAFIIVPGTQKASTAPSVPFLSAHEVLAEINASRVHERLSPLVMDSRLTAAAQHRLSDMLQRRYFGHRTPEGKYVWDTLAQDKCAYRTAAENLARGFLDEGKMEESWMRSAPHRANILNATFRLAGIAVAQDPPSAVVLFADTCG